MRKLLLFSFFLLLLFPLQVGATSVKNVEIIGLDSRKVGEELTLTFDINFSDLPLDYNSTKGIWIIQYDLDFDENIFIISDISTPYFNSLIYLDDGKYNVFSQVNDIMPLETGCASGYLYCANYKAKVKFFIKDTKATTATIKIGNVNLGLLDITEPDKTYTVDDVIEVTSVINQTHTVTIEQTNAPVITPPKDITNQKPTQPVIKKDPTVVKSSNALLKSLVIAGYQLDFDKNDKTYSVVVAEDVKELAVTAVPEDSKATVKITGADKIDIDNRQVVIEVTAENKTKNTYTINVKFNKETTTTPSEEKPTFKLDKNFWIYTGIIGGAIILISIIVAIIIKIKNRKIDNMFDKM